MWIDGEGAVGAEEMLFWEFVVLGDGYVNGVSRFIYFICVADCDSLRLVSCWYA